MEQEFTHIVTQHQGIIHKVCRIYRDTAEDREDLFQEIVYQLWKSFPSYRQQAKITTWMYRIALSTAVAKFRIKTAERKTVSIDGVVVAEATSSTHPEKERLYQAIEQLSLTEKAIITLYLDDYQYEEMAEIVGISPNYIGVKLNRIKQKLKQLLNTESNESR